MQVYVKGNLEDILPTQKKKNLLRRMLSVITFNLRCKNKS